MKLKVIFVLLLVLFLVSVAAIDAKSSGRSGGRSSGISSKSVSSTGSHSITGDTAKALGIASVPFAAKSTMKKTHLDDDLFENETENETENKTAQQSPGMGLLPAFLAMGVLLLATRRGKV